MTVATYKMIRTILSTAVFVITVLLLLRIVFLLFSVNAATPFVSWILAASSFLMSPFFGIVPNIPAPTGVLDVVAVIALFAYLLLGYLLSALIQELARPTIREETHRPSVHYHDIDYDEDEEAHRHHK